MRKLATVAAGLGAAVLLTTLTACGQSSDEAKADFCGSLDDFSSVAMSYQGLDPQTATNDEIDAATDDLADAWYAVEQDAADWANADDNALSEAYDDLYDAAQDLSGDNTAEDNLNDLEPQLDAIPGAFADTFDGSGCETG
jgi:hypothetical protein